MPTYTPNKNLIKPAYNEFIDDWDDPVNTDWDIIDKAFGGEFQISTTGGTSSPTINDCQNVYIKVTGALTGNATIQFPSGVRGFYIVDNVTTGAFTVTLASAGGSPGLSVLAVRNACTFIYSDGQNILLADNANLNVVAPLDLTGNTLSITPPIPVSYGGTGAVVLTANHVILGNGTSGVLGVAPGASGNVLTSNGTTWTSAPAAGSGGGVSSLGMYTATANGGLGLTFTSSGTNPLTGPGSFTLSGTLNPAYGGTGLNSYASGDLIYASGSTALSRLSAAASGNVLKSGTSPSWGKVDLANDVSGNLAVARLNSGTGASNTTFWRGDGTWAAATASISNTTPVTGITASSVLINNAGLVGGALTTGTGNVVLSTSPELTGTMIVVGITGTGNFSTSGNISATGSGAISTSSGNISTTSGALRIGTASALSGAEAASFLAGASVDGVVARVATNTQSTFIGQNSSGTETFTVTGNGLVTGNGGFVTGSVALDSNGTAGALYFKQSPNTQFYGDGSSLTALVAGVNLWAGSTTTFTVQNGITPQAYGTTTFTNLSDQRVKKNVQPYNLGVAALKQLNTITYQFNGEYGTADDGKTIVGLVAQDVASTPFSTMINDWKYTDPVTGQVTDLMSLNTSELVFALINAVKELTARVEALEAKSV